MLLRAEYPDTADQMLAKREIDGTLSGNVEFVKKTAEGEYQLTLSEVSFWEEGKGSLKYKKGSYFFENYKSIYYTQIDNTKRRFIREIRSVVQAD